MNPIFNNAHQNSLTKINKELMENAATKTESKFLWKDKTGRGFSSTMNKKYLLNNWANETNWDGEELHTWARQAEEGDVWENSTDYIIHL